MEAWVLKSTISPPAVVNGYSSENSRNATEGNCQIVDIGSQQRTKAVLFYGLALGADKVLPLQHINNG
jgi:hypothetical protein